jgi:hypothetical protein
MNFFINIIFLTSKAPGKGLNELFCLIIYIKLTKQIIHSSPSPSLKISISVFKPVLFLNQLTTISNLPTYLFR